MRDAAVVASRMILLRRKTVLAMPQRQARSRPKHTPGHLLRLHASCDVSKLLTEPLHDCDGNPLPSEMVAAMNAR